MRTFAKKATYHGLSRPGSKAHLVPRLHLVKEVSAPLQEAEDGVQEPVDPLAGLLGDGEKQVVVPLLDAHIYVYF